MLGFVVLHSFTLSEPLRDKMVGDLCITALKVQRHSDDNSLVPESFDRHWSVSTAHTNLVITSEDVP